MLVTHLPTLGRQTTKRELPRKLGIQYIYRETLFSSLDMGKRLLLDMEIAAVDVEKIIRTFQERDTQLIKEQHAVQHNEEQIIQSARETALELELLLRNDAN
jgi:hypothetical protein